MSILLLILIVCVLFLFTLLFLIYNYKKNGKVLSANYTVMSVLGSGGHTTEMLHLIAEMDPKRYTKFEFLIAETDKQSINQLNDAKLSFDSSITYIKRSREVGQSYLSSIFTTLRSILSVSTIVYEKKPDLLLIDGPGTCIPVFFWVVVLRSFNLLRCKIIFVESFCRVENLSLSGKIIYPFADLFVVQWKQLTEKYPKAKYYGILV